VQAHVRDLAVELMRQGHSVSVLAPADEDDEIPPYVISTGRAVPVPYNGSVARLAFGPRTASRVRKWIREGGFDVLHVHEPASPSLSLLATWAALGPIVATFHMSGRSRAMSAFYGMLQTALEKISARIAVSEYARTTLVNHLGGDAVLIPNGVDVRRFTTGERFPGWPGSGEVLGFLGRMDEPRKGLPVLLDAFVELAPRRRGLRLLLAGPGDAEDVYDEIPKALRDRVTCLGMVSEEDKVRMLRSVDIYVAPNTGGESFGIVLLEAMAAGTPVLASDLEAFARVLDHGRAGVLFPSEDSSALAKAADELLDNPLMRSELVEAGTTVVRRYDWATVARQVEAVYETVISPGVTVVEDNHGQALGRFTRLREEGLNRS
jgi:phosphatidylinositol alpha-mannosyltransferase